MVPPLAELTAQAQTLTSAGDFAGARAVLAHALDPADVDPQHASPDLAVAAALHARVLIALGDPHAARTWAGFAHAAEERLHGPHDPRTVGAAATHAAVLAGVGNHGRAAQLYHDLVAELTTLEGADSPRVLAAEADLATAQHASGQCTAARAGLAQAWARHRRKYGDAAPAGIKMLARLGVMERECGRTRESDEHLALAQQLCARYLPADHPLAVQLGRLAGAPASGRHVCGRVQQSTGPAPGVTTLPAGAPAAVTASPEPYRSVRLDPRAARRPPAAAPSPPPPPAPEPPPPSPESPPDNRPTDPKGAVYQAPLYLSQVHQAPGDLTGRHARADTPLPVPGQRPEYTEDGRRVPVGTAPVAPDGSDRRLPVPVEKPEQGSSKQPFVLAAMLVAGIGVAAAVVAATLPRGDDSPATGTSAPAVAPPAASAPAPTTSASGGGGTTPGAPTGVRLRDNRDSVSLTWTYPKGAEGPVLISGGRSGQEQRAFQQLPAGTSDYVVYGLNEQSNYCFTVAVVYTTERIATTAPICTTRR